MHLLGVPLHGEEPRIAGTALDRLDHAVVRPAGGDERRGQVLYGLVVKRIGNQPVHAERRVPLRHVEVGESRRRDRDLELPEGVISPSPPDLLAAGVKPSQMKKQRNYLQSG